MRPTLIFPSLYILIPFIQRKKFNYRRLWAGILLFIGCFQYHIKANPKSLRWYIDQYIMWIFGPYMLTYDYKPSVLYSTLLSGFMYFIVFNSKTDENSHAICVHLPIALAMYLQEPKK